MSYSVQNIRNVCLLGHSGSGKTALAESLLLMTGAIDRMGRAADGNTVCDYDQEEIKRPCQPPSRRWSTRDAASTCWTPPAPLISPAR